MAKRITRRALLRYAGIASGGLLAACQPKIVRETVVVEKEVVKEVTKIVEKRVQETVVVEGTPKVVEKIVKETVVVEAADTDEMSQVQELRAISPIADGVVLTANMANYSWPVQLLHMPLYTRDCSFEPTYMGLTTAIDVSDDRTVYTFRLRKDAKFSDGSPITAKDAKFSFDYYAMQAHPDYYGVHSNWGYFRQQGWMIKGAQDILDGKMPHVEFGSYDLEGVKVLDDYTLQVELDKPYPFFLQELSVNINKKESVELGKGREYVGDNAYAQYDYWTTEPGAAFSGPWKLASFTGGEGMVLVPNEYYPGPTPILKKIICTFAPDLNAAMAAFENKEVDAVIQPISGPSLRQALSVPYLRDSITLMSSYWKGQMWITPSPPMDDVHVRRAFTMAIDRPKLVEILNAGDDIYVFTPWYFVPENASCLEAKAKVVPLPFDPAAAIEELKQSSYGLEAVQNMEINITALRGIQPAHLTQVEAIHKMLVDNLGLKNLRIRTETFTDHTKPPFATHMWPNNQGDIRPDAWLSIYNMIKTAPQREYGPGEVMPQVTAPKEPEMEALVDRLRDEMDPKKRCDLAGEMYQMWIDKAYSISLFTQKMGILIAPWVKEFNACPEAGAYPYVQPGIEATWIAKR
ncbi:MAG: ABC transporter substrate-binding protein [Chloroflexi bacterium]|nr:ABC transporter substrate-binding protein [Chloroflexota bacterium]